MRFEYQLLKLKFNVKVYTLCINVQIWSSEVLKRKFEILWIPYSRIAGDWITMQFFTLCNVERKVLVPIWLHQMQVSFKTLLFIL